MKKNLLTLFICMLFGGIYAQVPLPYSQDFESTLFPPTGWQTFPIGSPINWVRDTTASGYGIGIACTSFDNYNTPAGSYYGIRLPSMNFSTVTQPYIRFDIAYAQRMAGGSDIFGLWWSNNGSSNWQNLQNYSGSNLATAPPTPILFVPSASQWQTKTLSLASLAGLPFVRLAIEDDCNHGNKIYFDNVIVFDSATVGIDGINNPDQFQVYPDPFSSFINIVSNSNQKIIRAELFNSIGILAASINKEHSIFIFENLSHLSEGIYLLKIYSENGTTINRKIMKR
ncbi:MAG: T9SS type A sorting domain-containing protein [Bacteroidia bacterium]